MVKDLQQVGSRALNLRDWSHFLIESIQVRFANYSVPDDLQGLVVSPGGVASTTIMKHIAQYKLINHYGNQDGLKHRPKPPSKSTSEIPVLFIAGDTHHAISSLRRRGYLPHQAIRLACWGYFFTPPRWRDRVLAHSVIHQENSWVAQYTNILKLSFDEIWDSAELIAQHFGIADASFVTNFPTRAKSKS